MIVWLASYPKSGNTLIRLMLSSYFFSNDGKCNFKLVKNIKQFPHGGLFLKMGIDLKDQNEVIRNYIKAQEIINKKSSIQFLKTHSHLFNFNQKNCFTNLEHSIGVIYIVRDPRNVVTSFSKYLDLTVDETSNFMINGSGDGLSWTSTWSNNFQSWKLFKDYKKYLLVKYEDLIKKPDEVFLDILKFIHKLKNINFTLQKEKFDNVIKTSTFERLQDLEKKEGFSEASVYHKDGEKIPFFNLGPKNDWKNLLNSKVKLKLEEAFEKEMKELGYI